MTKHGHILVINHDTVSLYLTKEILQFDDYQVSAASTYKEGIEILTLHHGSIQMIICDAGALVDDPFPFFESVSKIGPGIAIVVTASMIEMKKIGPVVERFSVEVLVKPYDGRMLMNFVRNYCS